MFMQIFFSIFKYQATFSKSFTIKLHIEKQYFNAFQNLWVIAFIDCKVLNKYSIQAWTLHIVYIYFHDFLAFVLYAANLC